MPSSCLGDLPVELLQAIASRLATEDLCSLRSSSKRIYESTQHNFRCSFFQKLQINLSINSLERLRDIANDSELAPHVHTLVVKFVDEPEDKLGEGLSWNRHPSGYLLPEAGVQQWTDVLRCLVNCTSFHLIRVGWSDEDTCLNYFTSTDIITVILNGIIKARISVREFFVDFIPEDRQGANALDERRLNVPDLYRPEFIAVWANLQALVLNFSMEQIEITDWIDPMFRHATDLRKLTIKFDRGDAQHAIIERLSSIETPSQLEDLTLETVTIPKISEASFSKLLCQYRDSLHVLNMRQVTLDDPSWKSVFRKVIDFPLLQSFSFNFLREDGKFVHFPIASTIPVTGQVTEFTFRSKVRGRRTINTCVRCRGPSAKATFQKLVESMEVDRPSYRATRATGE
ncbi:hypothetical protein N7478_000163 [Penicillium angulare]|uniref:uncharacterized protein n=1 Tax=Penicillium angulare TaxID=116970 RepID=UPI002541C287|nr:uncharacterized protein N7478_000163 [Penicillium angulare]KAJ5290912.1 hypothetical protein N7478_000163 [Penicillium angulare]